MKKELKTLIACLCYFTRLPLWKIVNIEGIDMRKTSKYFPLTGWLTGGTAAFVFFIFNTFLPKDISLLLSMSSSLIITGAIHEDGFADFCDGFGGGYTKENILRIMKDSYIGVFGTIGIIMMLAVKFFTLINIPDRYIYLSLISAHSVSRMISISFLYTHNYARNDSSSKSTVFIKRMSIPELIITIILGLFPLIFIEKDYIKPIIILVVLLYAVKTLLGMYFKRKIGGYTGDLMGATQQISEIIFYLGILIIIQYL